MSKIPVNGGRANVSLGSRGGAMDEEERIRLVRRVSGEDDVMVVDCLPSVAHYDDRTLTPRRMIRIGARVLVEMREHRGEWWMGEVRDGSLFVWGSYGSLEDAAAAH